MKNIEITKVKASRVPNFSKPEKLSFGKVFSDHMLVATYDNGKWGEVEIKPYAPLSLSPALAALHYGQSIFEGMKAFRNHQTKEQEPLLFRPDQNFKRLNISAERMCMPIVPENIFSDGLAALLELDKAWIPDKEGSALYIRPFLFASSEALGVGVSQQYQFMIITCPVDAYFAKPLNLCLETKYARACQGGVGFAKAAGNYGAAMLPTNEAIQAGYDQVIWTDASSHQYIEEAGVMNVFFVIHNNDTEKDEVHTPQTSDSILAGITRDSVLTLAKEWKHPVIERKISVKEIIQAHENGLLKEAFGVGTAVSVASIATIAYQEEGKRKEDTKPIICLSNQTHVVANKIKNHLNQIRTGQSDDTHGWIYAVKKGKLPEFPKTKTP